jgi:hypothetical protein
LRNGGIEFALHRSMALAPHLLHVDSPAAMPLAAPILVRGWIASHARVESVGAAAKTGSGRYLLASRQIATRNAAGLMVFRFRAIH